MPLLTPRYLVPFSPRELAHYFADVLIIGGGLAGLRAAHEIDRRLSVLVVTKDAIQQSNSSYAQGGIAGVLDPDDRFEEHVNDTLVAGGTLCDERVVDMVVREAPERIRELADWGTHFDQQAGRIVLGREGGHSRSRIVHALGDMTGKEVMRAVIEHTQRLPNVRIWENTFTLDLLTYEGACRGAIVATRHGKMLVWARQTILATGGCGQIYRESTNPLVATGDGHAMAYRAGAQLRDMEFVQFHPTVLYIAGGSRSLITEAVRGEGGWLVDRDGLRFMPQYDPRAELAPRDIVSQAIVSQMDKTRHPCVYLDVTHLDPQFVLQRFPGIAAACKQFGLDITRNKIPVRPGAHYMIGGVTIDLEGRTNLPGLWAAGEVSSSGLHGANRLASNSLLEGLVYGAHAGRGVSQAILAAGALEAGVSTVGRRSPDPAPTFGAGLPTPLGAGLPTPLGAGLPTPLGAGLPTPPPLPQPEFRVYPLENPVVAPLAEPLDLVDIRNSLKSLMWRQCGVRRSGEGLRDALESVDQWRRYVLPRQFDDIEGWELQNMLTIARVMIQAALLREESRGVHLRTDHPGIDDAHWNKHLWFERGEAQPLERWGSS